MERKLRELIDKAVSRRTFLTGASVAAAGTVLAGCGNGSPAAVTPPTPTPTPTAFTDVDYLNFALNLEYLEAEFYLRAATGNGLSSADTGNATSLTTGGSMVQGLSSVQMAYISEVAQNELDHVRFLRSALGSMAVNAPKIELTASFNALAAAANTMSPSAGVGTTFNPFASYNNYLIGAFIFEDVGVTAYHGAARLLTDVGHLTAAAEIHAVEAYHAGSIRTQIVAAGSSLITIANAVQVVRGALGGGNETTLTATGGIVAAATGTSVGFERTPDQVLHIVYGTAGSGAGVKSGVFFPAGLNGNISVTTT